MYAIPTEQNQISKNSNLSCTYLCGNGLPLLPPLVESEERGSAVHPLDEARAGAQRRHGVVTGVEHLLPVPANTQKLLLVCTFTNPLNCSNRRSTTGLSPTTRLVL